ncbi:FAR1 DNA-binding domain protein, partial [Trifolium medium]|nr:FAR1 DNA-binding domain protein [Trifolium medium]
MNNISADEVERYDFADLEIAYQFYYWYGRATGFSVRKSHVVRDHA